MLHQTLTHCYYNNTEAEAEANVHSYSHQIHRKQLLEINMPNRSIFCKMDVHPAMISAYSFPKLRPGDAKALTYLDYNPASSSPQAQALDAPLVGLA